MIIISLKLLLVLLASSSTLRSSSLLESLELLLKRSQNLLLSLYLRSLNLNIIEFRPVPWSSPAPVLGLPACAHDAPCPWTRTMAVDYIAAPPSLALALAGPPPVAAVGAPTLFLAYLYCTLEGELLSAVATGSCLIFSAFWFTGAYFTVPTAFLESLPGCFSGLALAEAFNVVDWLFSGANKFGLCSMTSAATANGLP